MKLTINIPETLNEVTLKQYQKWLKIADGKELDSFLQQKMVEILLQYNQNLLKLVFLIQNYLIGLLLIVVQIHYK